MNQSLASAILEFFRKKGIGLHASIAQKILSEIHDTDVLKPDQTAEKVMGIAFGKKPDNMLRNELAEFIVSQQKVNYRFDNAVWTASAMGTGFIAGWELGKRTARIAIAQKAHAQDAGSALTHPMAVKAANDNHKSVIMYAEPHDAHIRFYKRRLEALAAGKDTITETGPVELSPLSFGIRDKAA